MDDPTKALAKSLFGRPLRILLAEWILERGDDTSFVQQEAQDAMRLHGESPSGVAKELMTFVNCRMLERVEVDRNVRYVVRSNPLWSAFERMVESLRELDEKSNQL